MKPFHIFLILLTTAAWGLNFVSTRIVLEVFSTEQLAFARSAISFLILLPWWQPWRRVSRRFLAAAFAVGVLSFYILYEAIRMTDSLTTVAIGTQLMPPIATIIALVFYQEPVVLKKWVGIGVATAGAILLAGASGWGISALALGVTVLSVLFYAAGSVGVSRTEHIGIWRLLAWVAAVGIVPLGLLASLSGPLYPDPATIGLVHWLALAFSIVFSALLGQAVLFSLYRVYPVSDVAPYTLFVPVFAGLFSVLIFGEQLSLGLVVGGVVVLLGVWIQQTSRR
jgi:O-acetylserine/cysteine efflux transporter